MQETDFLFDKSYECPVCDNKIKVKTLRSGKARLLRTDMDLRPVYEGVEPLKYDPIICPVCGYSALARYFTGLTSSQAKAVRESISPNFKYSIDPKDTYTFDEAVYGYKMCLANAIVKRGKMSEIAYICLKMGWLYRCKSEALDPEAAGYEKQLEACQKQEKEYLKKAYDGFVDARQKEDYPMCGMDEMTVEYLIAVLAMYMQEYDFASKLIGTIFTSHSASDRIKDKARDVKEELLVRMKE